MAATTQTTTEVSEIMAKGAFILTIPAVLLASATAASARIVTAWECSGDGRSQTITVELHKYSTADFELRFRGALYVWGTGHGYNFKYVGQEGAKLNGKPCRVLPHDPKWDENN
jgi:hypothetical protein